MIMTKEEIVEASRWAANAESPLSRDDQILIMITAKERHEKLAERIKDLLKR